MGHLHFNLQVMRENALQQKLGEGKRITLPVMKSIRIRFHHLFLSILFPNKSYK